VSVGAEYVVPNEGAAPLLIKSLFPVAIPTKQEGEGFGLQPPIQRLDMKTSTKL